MCAKSSPFSPLPTSYWGRFLRHQKKSHITPYSSRTEVIQMFRDGMRIDHLLTQRRILLWRHDLLFKLYTKVLALKTQKIYSFILINVKNTSFYSSSSFGWRISDMLQYASWYNLGRFTTWRRWGSWLPSWRRSECGIHRWWRKATLAKSWNPRGSGLRRPWGWVSKRGRRWRARRCIARSGSASTRPSSARPPTSAGPGSRCGEAESP